MPQISARIATTLALSLLAVFAAAADTRADQRPIVIRIYDTGAAAALTRSEAIRTAASILDHAGIAIDWRDCTGDDALPRCQNRGQRDLIVRIMPTFVAGAGAHASSVKALKAAGKSESQLGFAIIDPHTYVGEMATIFHDRVETVARRTGVDCSELLGRALAHEIGHLLLRATGHSPTGLMRGVWTDGELTTNRPEDWTFAQPDRLRLQSGSIADRDLSLVQ